MNNLKKSAPKYYNDRSFPFKIDTALLAVGDTKSRTSKILYKAEYIIKVNNSKCV